MGQGGHLRPDCYLGDRGYDLLLGLDFSLKGLLLLQASRLIFQVPRRDWLFQLLDLFLDPVLGLAGVGTCIL